MHQEETVPTDSNSGDTQQLREEIARLQAMLADENSPTYRHRFEVLQGKYNAEIPRLTQQLRELEERVNEAPPDKPQQQPEYEEAYNDLVDEHGPSTAKNLITIAQAIAQQIVGKKEAELEARLQEKLRPFDEKVEQLTKGQQASAEQRFFESLDVLCPDWKEINGWRPAGITQDPKFTKFLSKTVPGSEFTYNDLLINHYQKGNAPKVKEIFDIFKAGNETKPQKGIEQYVDPSKTGKGTAPPANQPKTYTQAQVDAFFDSRIKGTFRGTREEAQALENEYTKAIYEGRVR